MTTCKRKATVITILLSLAILFTSFNLRTVNNEPALTAYNLEVISYFKEIALGFEYGGASGLVRKWKAPMRVYIMGAATPALRNEVSTVVTELNGLISDGFMISVVEKKQDANFVIFFGSRKDFIALHPADARTVEKSSGLFHIFWNAENNIVRGYAFVHTDNTTEQEQKHTIREEVTQALGLGKDSPRYSESIFQSTWTTPTSFSKLDREIIRLLYHPSMLSGSDDVKASELLTEILAAEQVASNLDPGTQGAAGAAQ